MSKKHISWVIVVAFIIVIGAGPSGIVYSKEMERLGHTVLVLEAEGEVGGRTRSIEFAGSEHPLGAAFNHMPETSVPGLERPIGRSYDLEEEGVSFFDGSGQDVTGQVSSALEEEEFGPNEAGRLALRFVNYMHYSSAASNDFAAIDNAVIDSRSVNDHGLKFSAPEEVNIAVGAAWSRSIKESAKKVMGDIITNAKVTAITDHGNGAIVTYSKGDEEVLVRADHVHIAVPASAVKHIKIEGPAAEVLPAINSVVTGKAVRVLFEYPQDAIVKSSIADNPYNIVDTEEFGMLAIENHQRFDKTSSSLRVMLLGDAAVKADNIIESEGIKALEGKLASILSSKFGLPKEINSYTHSWQQTKSAEGSFPLGPNPMERMETSKIPGAVSFGGDYQPFDCHTKASGREVECFDHVGTVQGAAISAVKQAEATHGRFSEKARAAEVRQTKESFNILPVAEAASPWLEQHINNLSARPLLPRKSHRDQTNHTAASARRTGFNMHPNMCNVVVPSMFMLMSIVLASNFAKVGKKQRHVRKRTGRDNVDESWAVPSEELPQFERERKIRSLTEIEQNVLRLEKEKLAKLMGISSARGGKGSRGGHKGRRHGKNYSNHRGAGKGR